MNDRRTFLKILGKFSGTILGAVLLYKFFLPSRNNNSSFFYVKIDDIPGEGALIIPEKKLAVLRKKGEFEVYSTICTHLGCNVSFSKEGFACPCHGSRFDIAGNVIKGPAIKPLNKVKFKITSDKLKIFV